MDCSLIEPMKTRKVVGSLHFTQFCAVVGEVTHAVASGDTPLCENWGPGPCFHSHTKGARPVLLAFLARERGFSRLPRAGSMSAIEIFQQLRHGYRADLP